MSITSWIALSDHQNPEVGKTIRAVPTVDVDHGDGSGHTEELSVLGVCKGTIVQVGAHYSEPGRSGW